MNKYITLLLILLTLMAGCASTKTSEFYVLRHRLSTPATETFPGANKVIPVSLGVGPVTIPKLLDRPQIVTRAHDNAVKIAEYQRWAQPLRDNINAVLVRNLTALRPNDSVSIFPSAAGDKPDYRTSVEVWQFDANPGKNVILEAVLVIRNSESNSIIHREHTIVSEASEDESYGTLAKTMSAALYQLSKKISSGLDKVKKQTNNTALKTD